MIRDRIDPVAIAEICVRDDVVLANVREKWISFAVVHELSQKSFCSKNDRCFIIDLSLSCCLPYLSSFCSSGMSQLMAATTFPGN